LKKSGNSNKPFCFLIRQAHQHIRLDEAVMEATEAWAADIRRTSEISAAGRTTTATARRSIVCCAI